jgi:hypothetical protein
MKKFWWSLSTSLISLSVLAQNGANEILVAPASNDPYILVDTLFTLDNYPATYTDVYVHFANPTATPVKAVQFRLFYDNAKFSNAVMFWGPTAQPITDKYGSYFTNAGYINVVASYTGSTPNFDWADGAMFKLRLFHSSAYNGVATSMAISGSSNYPALATIGNGTDVNLELYSYGGAFQMTPMTFPVKVRNADGSPAQGVWFSAKKRLKSTPLATWQPIDTDSTNMAGLVEFTHPLDTNYWHMKISAQTDSMSDGGALTIVDAYKLANHVSSQDTLSGIEYYEGDINESQSVTVSDAFAVFNRLALNQSNWDQLFTGVNNVSVLWPSQWATANAATTAPNWTNVPRLYVIDSIVNSLDSLEPYIYVVGDATTSGYNNPATILAKMANPGSGTDYILDPAVYFSNKPDSIEFRIPKLIVTTDNYIDVPVTVYTFGNKVGALQMGIQYDTAVFEFVSLNMGDSASKWTSFMTFKDGGVFWAGHEDKMNPALLQGPSQVFTFRFAVKSILGWRTSPLAIFNKAAGDENAYDMSIRPSPNDGSVINGKADMDEETRALLTGFITYPNPVTDLTDHWLIADFYIEDFTNFSGLVLNSQGQIVKSVSSKITERGFQTQGIWFGDLPNGIYIVKLTTNDREKFYKIIKY